MAAAVLVPSAATASELYATNHGLNTITPFSIGANGAVGPTTCAGTSCATGQGPIGVAVSPNGRFVYAADYGANAISAFSIATSGSVAPIPCPGCATGVQPFGMAVSPGGRFVFTSNFQSATVSAFSIAANGSLAPIACTGTGCSTGLGPTGVAVSPNGRFLYTANESSDSVSAFSIAAGGSLSEIACAAGCATAGSPIGVTVSPNGQYLYAADSGSDRVSAFSIGGDGSLSPIVCAGCNTGSQPYGVAASPNGQFLYTINRGASTVSAFTIAADGSLSPIACAGTNCDTGAGPEGLAVSPSGQFLYTVSHSGAVSGFSIAPGGSVTPIPCPGACSVGPGPDFQAVAIAPDQAPVASFTTAPAPAGHPSRLNGSSSSASAGQKVARYDWSFGDGASAANAGPRPMHTYAKPGTYTVTLNVTDDAGCGTQQTFTGQTVSCNGSPAASKSAQITVPALPAPAITSLRQAARSWREHRTGKRRLPVGTSFSFSLNEPAMVSLSFSRCATQPKRSRCTRHVAAGQLIVNARAGANKVRFAGRISPGKTLRPGRYTLAITARNAAGQRSQPRALSFTIGS
jgi:DNA-binding beta-propeller fold protein YncE